MKLTRRVIIKYLIFIYVYYLFNILIKYNYDRIPFLNNLLEVETQAQNALDYNRGSKCTRNFLGDKIYFYDCRNFYFLF